MTETIGAVPWIDLVINSDGEFAFDVELWGDDEETIPLTIASLDGTLAESEDGEPILVWEDYATIVGNVGMIRVPPEVTAVLPNLDRGRYDIFVTALDSGERMPFARGSARINQKVGAS